MSQHAERCQRAQLEMQRQDVDWLLIPHSTDLKYLIGYAHRQSERLALFLVPREGVPVLVVPSFEIATVERYATFFDIAGWTETEDPVALVASILQRGPARRVAVGEELHAVFLLKIQAALTESRFNPATPVMARLRMIKAADEVTALRTAAERTDAALTALLDQPLLNMTELDVIRFLHAQLLERGFEAVGTGIVGAGPNAASPHHRTSNRSLQPGDAVVVDFGGSLGGYRSDMTRTFHLDEPSQDFRRVYDIVREAQQRAFEAVRPGVTAESIDAIARDHISEQGYGPYFLHRTGHGIGLDGHEAPYLVKGDSTVLEEGMTFSIEPGIYLRDRFGVRIEDIVVVTRNGAERFNQFSRDLIVISATAG